MRRSGSALATVGLLLLLPRAAPAQSIAIAHDAVGCIQANKFPQFFARFDPRDAVSRARLHFRPIGWPHWYSVPMTPEGANFVGVLPKPEKSLAKMEYYISVMDQSFGESRSQEYSPVVVSGPAACQQNKLMATALAKARSVIVSPPQGIAGLPKVPVGFSSDSVVAGASGTGSSVAGSAGAAGAAGAGAAAAATTAAAAGGGIPTAVFVVGGLAVAGAGVAVAKGAGGGGDGGSGPSAKSYAGPFNGQLTIVTAFPGGSGCSVTRAMVGAATATLDQPSGSVNGTFLTNGTEDRISGTCQPPGPSMSASWAASLTGTAGNLAAHLQQGPLTSTGVAVVTTTSVFEFSGALSGNAITGTLTYTYSGQGQADTGPVFTLSGSVAIPVTLQ